MLLTASISVYFLILFSYVQASASSLLKVENRKKLWRIEVCACKGKKKASIPLSSDSKSLFHKPIVRANLLKHRLNCVKNCSSSVPHLKMKMPHDVFVVGSTSVSIALHEIDSGSTTIALTLQRKFYPLLADQDQLIFALLIAGYTATH